MKCPSCGVQVEQNAVYCHQCGERMDTAAIEPPEQDQQNQDFEAPAPEPPPAAGSEEPRTMADRVRESVRSRQDSTDDAEQELWKGRYCGKAMIGTWILCGLITVALVAVGIWFSVNNWMPTGLRWSIILVAIAIAWGYPLMLLVYRRLSIRYRLTTQRFFHEAGILRHVTDRIEVIDMDDITFDQTLLQRLVHVGTIQITSSDRTHPVLRVEGVENVKAVASQMDDARRVERIRRGLHIEAV